MQRRASSCIVAAILVVGTACASDATAPTDGWVLDAAPFPSTVEVGSKTVLSVIAMNAAGDTRFDVVNPTITSADPSRVRISGDTAIALGVSRVDLTFGGSLDGHSASGSRTIIVLPAPAGAR